MQTIEIPQRSYLTRCTLNNVSCYGVTQALGPTDIINVLTEQCFGKELMSLKTCEKGHPREMYQHNC